MLLHNFFEIREISNKNNQIIAIIKIDPNHSIFEGHFPGQPVVPGVCMLQMTKEILAQTLNQKLMLRKGNQIKYLELVVPQENQLLEFQIKYTVESEGYSVSAKMKNTEKLLYRFQGVFKTIN